MSYALVTGAAKGIGKAIATGLAERKYHLLLVDIDEDGLRRTAQSLEAKYPVTVQWRQQDLSAPDVISRLWSWTNPYHHDLRVIVNNAGYGLNGRFEEIPVEDHLNLVDLNIKAQVRIVHAYLPVLRQFPSAWLLNVGSTTSYQTVPYLNTYAASKAFVLSFTRGLRHELRHSPVSVSCLSPGSTDTDFVNRAGMGAATRRLASRFNMTPETVADVALRGLFSGKTEIVPGFINRLNAFLPKFFPKKLVERIAGNIYDPERQKEAGAPASAPVLR